MSRALALVLCCALSSAAAGADYYLPTPPADPENWIAVVTSQTPPGAVDWWYRRASTYEPVFIDDFPTVWVQRSSLTSTDIELNFGGDGGLGAQHRMEVNFTPAESALSTLDMNIAPAAGGSFDVTLTSSAGVRTINRQVIVPEPSGWALAFISLAACSWATRGVLRQAHAARHSPNARPNPLRLGAGGNQRSHNRRTKNCTVATSAAIAMIPMMDRISRSSRSDAAT